MKSQLPLVIFGTGQNSQVIARYVEDERPHSIACFCVDDEYYCDEFVDEKRVVPFSRLGQVGNANDILVLAPLYGAKMGMKRQLLYERLKGLGYQFTSFVSRRATVMSTCIGENVVILDGNTIQPFVEIGNNVMLWSNNHIGHHSVIGSNTTITSGVVVSGNCTVGSNCFCGVNTTIADNVRLADYTFTSAGSLISKDTQENGTYIAEQSGIRKIDSRRLRY